MKSIIEDFTELGNKLSELEGKPRPQPSGASRLCPKCKGTGKYIISVTMGMPNWASCEYCCPGAAPPKMQLVRKFCTGCLGAGGLCPECSGRGYHEVVEPVPPSYSHYHGGAPAAAPPHSGGWAHKDPNYGSAPGVAIWQCKNCGDSDFTDHPNHMRGCDSCGHVYNSRCLSCASPRVGLATDGSAYVCHDCGYWQ